MGFFRRVAGLLGFGKDDGHEEKGREHDKDVDVQLRNRVKMQETGLPRKGFGVPVQVAVERPQPVPVLLPCNAGDGGVQGLRWYAKQLRIDEEGDVADEFLNEVIPETSSIIEDKDRPLQPRFEVNHSTKPAKVKKQIMTLDGKIQQYVEHQGRIQCV